MKILFVTHRYPPRTGGVETHVREIATRLVERGHEVTVLSADAGSEVPTKNADEGVQVRRFRSIAPDQSFYLAPQLANAVHRADADVVHAHNYHALPLFFAALGVTDERFVVTTHYHGGSASTFRKLMLSFYRPFGRWAVQQADETIAVSEWERGQLREDFGVEATVIPNGLDVTRFAQAKPGNWNRPYILCVGRLEQYKGVQHAIHSLPLLPDQELVVAGSGPYLDDLKAIAADLGVTDRTSFLGYVEDEKLPRLFAGADAYLQLSAFEAYGITVAESIAAGTPIVVRKAGALIDWLELEGIVGVNDVEPRTVATAVLTAINGPDPDINVVSDWNEVVDELYDTYLL